MPKNLAGGLRMNAAFTYLAAARARPNLTLVADVLVDRVVVEDGRGRGADQRRRRDERPGGGLVRRPLRLTGGAVAFGDRAAGAPAGAASRSWSTCPGWVSTCWTTRSWCRGRSGRGRSGPKHAPAAGVLTQLAVKARSRMVRDEIDLHLYEGQQFDEQRGRWCCTWRSA